MSYMQRLEFFAFIGCLTTIYISARLAIKGIYRLTCFAIRKIEDQNRDDNVADESDSDHSDDSR